MKQTIAVEKYMDKLGEISPDQKTRIEKAIALGFSLRDLERATVGDKVLYEAFLFSQSFKEACTEDRFRVQQAVLYGHSISNLEIVDNGKHSNS